MQPKITVVLCTKRKEPRFDWAFQSLGNQTFKEFEYIIVDGYWHLRREYVENMINEYRKKGIIQYPIRYMPDKPSRWRGKRPALCNARNTALIYAGGYKEDGWIEGLVFHDDNCKMPADWLEKHYKWLKHRKIVAGNWISYESEGVVGPYGWEHRNHFIKEPKKISGKWLYGGNFSFPIHAGLDINGFDEELDGEMGQDDISFGVRAERKGYKIIYDPGCHVEYILHNHGLIQNYISDYSNYWKKMIEAGNLEPGAIEPKKRVLKDGKEHFANEWHTQKLLGDPGRYLPYGNNFDIRLLRDIARGNGYNIEKTQNELERYIDPNKQDWRDGEIIEMMK